MQATWTLLERWLNSDETSLAGLLELLKVWLDCDKNYLAKETEVHLILKLADRPEKTLRILALNCLHTLLHKQDAVSQWSDVLVQLIFRLLYRRILLELR